MGTIRRKGLFGGLLTLGLAVALVASLQAVKTPPAQAQSGENLQAFLDWYYENFGEGTPEERLKEDVPGTMQRILLTRAEPKECWYRTPAWTGSGSAPDRLDDGGNQLPSSGTHVAPYGTPENGSLLNGVPYDCNPAERTNLPFLSLPFGCTETQAPVFQPGPDIPGRMTCPGIPKVNESYIWAMTPGAKNHIWAGTAPNVLCTASAEIFGGGGGGTSGTLDEGDLATCEGGRSEPAHDESLYPNLANRIGDWRPPVVYRYNLKTGARDEMLTAAQAPLINQTFGLRAAHTHKGVVFLAGPDVLRRAVNMFAFRASDGQFLGQHSFTDLANIRRFTVAGKALYMAAGVDFTTVSPTGDVCATGLGRILRWRGSETDPFNFERVGCVAGEAVEIAAHDGRLYITDWPPVVSSGGELLDLSVEPGVWMSPRLGDRGLRASSALGWTQVFRWSEYERSQALSLVYGGGPLISYGGRLIVTSMHFPFANILAHLVAERYAGICDLGDTTCVFQQLNAEEEAACPDSDPNQEACEANFELMYSLAAQRPTVMVRLDNLDTSSPSKELLYGMPAWPIWDGDENAFVLRAMRLGFPRYGLAGYGNFFNNYTWGLAVQNGRLFATTFDFGNLFGDPTVDGSLSQLRALRPTSAWGGDVIRFDTPSSRGRFEVAGGADNYLNYGFRSILPLSDGVLLGSANPYNLATDLNHPDGVLGGWELIKLKNPS